MSPAPCIRPIRAADYALLHAFVRGLSRETSYKRLMSGRTPSDDEIRRWADIDRRREYALVAVAQGGQGPRIVGVARYVSEAPQETDFALVIADDWQHRGLGRALLERLIGRARRHGVRTLSGTTLTENIAMVTLARRLGFETRRAPGAAFATLLRMDLPLRYAPGVSAPPRPSARSPTAETAPRC